MSVAPPFRIVIGYDGRETHAWAVLAHSILSRASLPIALIPLTRQALARVYTRERGPTESTEFSLTRFLVPHLCNYEGLALFLDCDMVCQADVLELLLYPLADPGKAVYVVPHDYTPATGTKFFGQVQTAYPRKNWSSVMLFDCAQCQALTPEYVNTASGLELHRFAWLRDDQIGALPLTWNHLVGEMPDDPHAKLLHYTNGTPNLPGYADSPRAADWWAADTALRGGA
jgi:hypothetical protein